MLRLLAGTLSVLVLLLSCSLVLSQTPAEYLNQAKAIQNDPRVKAAFEHIDKNRESILREWIAITEINAPSGHEQERAKYIERLLRKQRLQNIHYDAAGNLIAVRKGAVGGPVVVFDAHLDTVFQPGLKIKASIREGRVHAPGVGDDTRNIEALLATIRALDAARIETKGDLVFVFTVEEETNFTGVKQFIKDNKGQNQLLRRARRRLRRIHLCRHWHQLVPASLHRARWPHAFTYAALLRELAAGPRDFSDL